MQDIESGLGPDTGGDDLVLEIAEVQTPPLLPEIRFAGVPSGDTLESFRTRNAARLGVATPYWAVAWPGGQALARYILDNPDLVRGRRVLDLGCGAGLCAVAAAMAGASDVTAVDSDAMAIRAARVSARLNSVRVRVRLADFTQVDCGADVVCAGDLWYDKTTGRHATSALVRLHAEGRLLLIGDALRPGRPRVGVTQVARYPIDVPNEFGMKGQSFATVSRLDFPS